MRALLLLALAQSAYAQKSIMEGVNASRYTIKVDTNNARVLIDTTSYTGGIGNVGLFTSSNIVAGTLGAGKDSVVIYATGTVSTRSGQFSSGVQASTGQFTGTGNGTYSITLSSGLSFSATATGIKWSDGTVSTTAFSAPAAAPAAVAQSTVTRNIASATTATTFSVCYATGTLTTGGSAPVAVHYSGALRNSGAVSSFCILNVLLDGSFISPWTNTQGMAMSINTGSNLDSPAMLYRVFAAPAAGSHTWCLALAASANTCTFSNVSFVGNEFGVTELR